uniref:Cytochrome P450 71A20 n=1 Tax=Noccaea caerulescens TaxID=107243 RepID=A0A1J3K0D3_NOCCA
MEMILVSLCLTTLLAFLFLKSVLKRTANNKHNLPPSPWRLPLIGNLHQLSLHPHRSIRSLSLRYGPLMLIHFGRVPILVVSSADVAHDVMKIQDLKFANRPKSQVIKKILNGGRNLAFSPYGEYWKQIKSVCVLNLLSNKMVRSFEKVREEEINLIMEKLEKASSYSSLVNLSELLGTLTVDVICRLALGGKYSGCDEKGEINFRHIIRTYMELLGTFPVGEYIPSLAWIDRICNLDGKVKDAIKKSDSFLERVVQEHEVDDGAHKDSSDFVDILLSVQKDKTMGFEFNRSDLKIILLDMFIGGTSTTFTLMEWTMTELMRHPECMSKLQDEIRSISPHNLYVKEEEVEKMTYLNAVVKEALRLHPPAPLLPRLLTEDVKLKGYDIAAGTHVFINAWAIQRDTSSWGLDAEEFRPERHLNSPLDFQGHDLKFIPFGSGRRICPGIRTSLALAEVTLANLVKRFNWRVEVGPLGDGIPDLVEAIGIDVCRKFPLIVFPSSAFSST